LAYLSMLDLLMTELPSDDGCRIKELHVGEEGIIVSFDRKAKEGEIAYFFRSDHPSARECFAMNKEGIKCCDYLFLYMKKENISRESEVICFLELKKGRKIEYAGKQIKDTYFYFMSFARAYLSQKQLSSIIKSAAVYIHGSAPPDASKKVHKELIEIFGSNRVEVKHSSSNFAHFIRRIYDGNQK
jgi:hypothetical protein